MNKIGGANQDFNPGTWDPKLGPNRGQLGDHFELCGKQGFPAHEQDMGQYVSVHEILTWGPGMCNMDKIEDNNGIILSHVPK